MLAVITWFVIKYFLILLSYINFVSWPFSLVQYILSIYFIIYKKKRELKLKWNNGQILNFKNQKKVTGTFLYLCK